MIYSHQSIYLFKKLIYLKSVSWKNTR